MSLTHLAANLAGAVRRETLNGREHVVAPLSLVVPGVLNGSNGSLYYPAEELQRSVDAWNGMPIVVYHPKVNGIHVSARNPDVLNTSGVGVVLKASYNGKLRAEGWFDVQNLQRVSDRIAVDLVNQLESGQPIELSTGLFLEPEDKEGEFNGKPYVGIARNHRPDHLAILPDQKGACSLEDGCGVNVNKTSNKGEEDMAKVSKKELVDSLITNCDCKDANVWNEEDRKFLDSLSEDRIKALVDNRNKQIAASKEVATANKKVEDATKSFKDGDKEYVFNADKNEWESKEKEPERKQEPAPTANKHDHAKPKTAKEWLEDAPEEVRSVVTNAMEWEKDQKTKLIKAIVANDRNVFTEDQLKRKPLDELRAIANLAVDKKDPKHQSVPNYAGANPAVNVFGDDSNDGEDDDDDMGLPLPTINYDELSTFNKKVPTN